MRNRFKYICRDCGSATWLSAPQRNRRHIPRCAACGSSWLDPSKRSEAKERVPLANDESVIQRRLREEQQNIKRGAK